MKYLVTGSQGCIGAWILKNLIERGTPVIAYDSDVDCRRLSQIVLPEQLTQVKFVKGDVRDLKHLSATLAAEGITHVIHLAGLQVPTCRKDPILGAEVNVAGTLTVFEAVKQVGHIQGLVYASSAAVIGPEEAYGSGPVPNDAPLLPRTHYGVFKQCNEGNARVYFLDDGVSSVGLRPYTVYGPGRDTGMTSDITKAIKAAVVGRPFRIRFGGRNDLQFVDDTARAFLCCAEAGLQGARAYNLQGAVVHIAREFVPLLEDVCPDARDSVTCTEAQLPIAPELDDSAMLADVGGFTKTALRDGITKTVETFRRLRTEGRLDVADLDE